MPAKKEIKINLLPQKEFERSTLGRVLKWALSSFRIIVIAVEMIVMVAFLSRFWLDAKNSDLSSLVNQKKNIIISFQEVENKFRIFQKQLSSFTVLSSSSLQSEYVDIITSFAPSDIILSSILDSENAIIIIGTSPSEQSVSQFVKNISSQNKFKDISVNKIETDKNSPTVIIFTIKITISANDKTNVPVGDKAIIPINNGMNIPVNNIKQ